MTRVVTLAAVVVLGLAGTGRADAPAPKADCSKYHKLSDGRWTSTIEARVGNPKSFVVLQPGVAIDRALTVAGINVSATLDGLCGK